MAKEKILITGSSGQIGTELAVELRKIYGEDSVITSDIKTKSDALYEVIDVLDKEAISNCIKKHQITQIYHLASLLSATGEQKPKLAWDINFNGLIHILDLAVEYKLNKVFWPSSIAVFGPTTPRVNTPQITIMEPNTVYGITKLTGERWCDYYFHKHGLDVRSIRYPGLISYKTPPGGGTTDYAVDIYFKAIKEQRYECFLSKESTLPMMYMDDAIRGTIELMEAPKESIKVRSSYNLAAISFSPEEIAKSIQKHIPEFQITYNPDFRQKIADSWPQSINDQAARKDWGWKHHFDLNKMTEDMLKNIPSYVY